ncbi:hypothetical protein FOZ61_006840 [Perkinsus olseni]|uniref:Uncharacterized protein n=1 Tax=Perkinsus olseni TaxID=32597 RepID=A0A7J6MHD0_PEROL|nr:hypothetical protein FOZ61_006840 [Perkinsus olseni]KAF4676083.1 hypothetical protein FOL46_007961 [Perkinsus olseni]
MPSKVRSLEEARIRSQEIHAKVQGITGRIREHVGVSREQRRKDAWLATRRFYVETERNLDAEIRAAVDALSGYDPEIHVLHEQLERSTEEFTQTLLSPILALRQGLADAPENRAGKTAELLLLVESAHDRLGEEPFADAVKHRESIKEALEIVSNAHTTVGATRDEENLSDAEEELLDEGNRHLEPPEVILMYQRQLEGINEQCCEQLTASSAKIETEKAALRNILPQCDEYIGQWRRENAVTRTPVELLLPEMSKLQVSEIERISQRLCLLRRKRRVVFRRWRQRRLEALHGARKEYKAWLEEKAEAVTALEKRTQAMMRAQVLRERLDDALASKHAREAGERMDAQKLADAEAVKKATLQERRRQYVEALRKRVQEHRKCREEVQREKAKRDAEKKHREKKLKLANSKVLAARVAHREKMTAIRAQEREFGRELVRAEAKERRARIQRALEKFGVRAAADPERLVAIPPHKKTEGEHPLPREIFERHGYGVEELERDPRYRLQAALYDAGLHMSNSGHEVLLSMAPKKI